MKKLYEIYIESKGKERFLVSKERLDFFICMYRDVEIIKELDNYTFIRHSEYFTDMPPAGCRCIIVNYKGVEYICRDYTNEPWKEDNGLIWDIRTEKYYKLKEELERLRIENSCSDWEYKYYSGIASRSGADIDKLGNERLERVVVFFRDYKANVRREEEELSRCN